MGLAEAMTEARKRGSISSKSTRRPIPRSARFSITAKFKYNLDKKEKDTKKNSSATKLKELNFHMNIDEHDYGVKMRHAEEFMWKGMKVKLQLKFRGREMMHQDIGMNLIRRMRADLNQIGVADTEPKLIGKSINLMLSPLPARKRVRKFSHEDEPAQEEESTIPRLKTVTALNKASTLLNGNK